MVTLNWLLCALSICHFARHWIYKQSLPIWTTVPSGQQLHIPHPSTDHSLAAYSSHPLQRWVSRLVLVHLSSVASILQFVTSGSYKWWPGLGQILRAQLIVNTGPIKAEYHLKGSTRACCYNSMSPCLSLHIFVTRYVFLLESYDLKGVIEIQQPSCLHPSSVFNCGYFLMEYYISVKVLFHTHLEK